MSRGLALSLFVLLVAAGCSAQPAAPPAPAPTVTVTATVTQTPMVSPSLDCTVDYTRLTSGEIDEIRAGLKFDSDQTPSGLTIPLEDLSNTDLGYTKLVVVYDEDDSAMFLAAGDYLQPLLAVDDLAQATFTWGEDTRVGSPAGEYRDLLAKSELVARVDACGPPKN